MKSYIKRAELLEQNKTQAQTIAALQAKIKQLENQGVASENSYQKIFEESSQGIFVFDKKGVIQDVNKRLLEIYGDDKKAVVGKQVKDFFEAHQAAYDKIKKYIEAVWQSGYEKFELAELSPEQHFIL